MIQLSDKQRKRVQQAASGAPISSNHRFDVYALPADEFLNNYVLLLWKEGIEMSDFSGITLPIEAGGRQGMLVDRAAVTTQNP